MLGALGASPHANASEFETGPLLLALGAGLWTQDRHVPRPRLR